MSQIFTYRQAFTLESGKTINGFQLAYTTAGLLNERKDNVVWIFHALTANSDPTDWWHGLVGSNTFFDPKDYFIVCVNMPGSCYGSISALDTNPATGTPWYQDFPLFTTRDMVRAYAHLKKSLGIEQIAIGIGGSMGGQQLLEWAVEEPLLFRNIIPIATNAQHSPWGIAFNTSQRMCIENDPTWQLKLPEAGIEGMKVARTVALLSYRNYYTYHHSQAGITETSADKPVDEQVFRASTYQQYQGEKLAKRFNAFSYYYLSQAMDKHHLGRGRGSVEAALQRIKARTLVIGISSDILFPPEEQQFLAQHIPGAQISIIDSHYGHDGFLLEYDIITRLIKNFLSQPVKNSITQQTTIINNL
ncbi:homoserine O-acetyltransferase family protein [Deminuibacter soli]|uniref:Homoserine O-acetyltransferase n=1 Tax=Deminuibacter soli TaxID=2291815 RepID=A0A3E1NNC9_9BACT|nr:homoserine O-acetyltransferase [Deminuibacter soli]RFM29431.1 homoserine O-acetyltransferase [Deminuibacter soli]